MGKSLAHETASFGGSLLSRSWNSIKNTAHSAITGVKNGLGGVIKNTKGLLLAGGVLLFPYTALGAGAVYATAKTAKGLFHVFKGEGTKGWEEIKSGVTDPLTFVWKEGGAKVIDAGAELGKGATTIVAAPFAAVGDALGTNENINSQNLRSRSNGSSSTSTASESPTGQSYAPESTEKPEGSTTNHHNDKKENNNPTPIPVPIPTGGSNNTEKEAKKAQEKADKEAKDAQKKADEEKKKEEAEAAKKEKEAIKKEKAEAKTEKELKEKFENRKKQKLEIAGEVLKDNQDDVVKDYQDLYNKFNTGGAYATATNISDIQTNLSKIEKEYKAAFKKISTGGSSFFGSGDPQTLSSADIKDIKDNLQTGLGRKIIKQIKDSGLSSKEKEDATDDLNDFFNSMFSNINSANKQVHSAVAMTFEDYKRDND